MRLRPIPMEVRWMPTVADVEPLQEILHSIEPGAPLVHGALTVIPLLTPSSEEVDWVTLEEAGDDVVVTEAAGGASVPTLQVNNAGDRPLLLLDGEELIGAKQNRVLNTTVLVGAHSTVTIPVSCVEAGRWAYRTARFAAGGTSLYASLRADKAAQVTDSLRLRGRHPSDQAYIATRHIYGRASPPGSASSTRGHRWAPCTTSSSVTTRRSRAPAKRSEPSPDRPEASSISRDDGSASTSWAPKASSAGCGHGCARGTRPTPSGVRAPNRPRNHPARFSRRSPRHP